jgi:hypothetical protein
MFSPNEELKNFFQKEFLKNQQMQNILANEVNDFN